MALLIDIDVRRNKSLKINGKLDWDIFVISSSILDWDKPNLPVIKMAQLFKADGFKIVIFQVGTIGASFKLKIGSRNTMFHLTFLFLGLISSKTNLGRFDGNPATADMRFMSDDILKKKMLDTFVDIKDVFLVVDDRQKVVDMWRDLGLNTFQVAR